MREHLVLKVVWTQTIIWNGFKP